MGMGYCALDFLYEIKIQNKGRAFLQNEMDVLTGFQRIYRCTILTITIIPALLKILLHEKIIYATDIKRKGRQKPTPFRSNKKQLLRTTTSL